MEDRRGLWQTPAPMISAVRARRVLLCGALALAPGALPAAATDVPPGPVLRPAAADAPARSVAGLHLRTGTATLELASGAIWPLTSVGGRAVEWVFVGRGRAKLEPPDEIERSQLELFTGASALDEEFTAAVFAVANDAAGRALEARPEVTVAPEAAATARALAASWRASAERRLLEVEAALWADAAGERLFEGYFAAWIEGAELGRFLYVVDPATSEQVTLGRFEPLAADARDRRKIERRLRREQREGRLVGQRFEDLGVFDHWVSTAMRGADGAARPGNAPFEPVRYQIDVAVEEREEGISGSMTVELVSVIDGARVVPILVHPDLTVESVRLDEEGSAELERLRGTRAVVARLPDPIAAGGHVRLRVAFRGRLLERDGSSWALRDTIGWHPHLGTVDRATYDVTFEWPERLALVASGRRVDGGVRRAGRRWERRTLEAPALAFGFEIGRYEVETFAAGGVAVRLAFDPDGKDLGSEVRREIRMAIVSGLEFLTSTFGPPPSPELTVVSTPREFSQSLPGLVTLSNFMMADFGWFGALVGIEDRRTVVVHELAHQWWGHQVGWRGYRDQWLSEAMANYSALAWARAELPAEQRPALGPTSLWRLVLDAETVDGRTVESLGPLVAGFRLSSSKSEDAYGAIVYKKGAIVLDMLANVVGQETFLANLGRIVAAAAGKRISTEDLLAMLERTSGTELDDFAARYVYGTGQPEIVYDYRIAPAGDRWVVEGTARQQASWRRRFVAERAPDGSLTVRAHGRAETDVARDVVIAPLQIGVFLPDVASDRERRRFEKGELPDPNRSMLGRIAIRGAETPFRFEVEHRPVRFWIDRDGEAFARFRDATRSPKMVALARGSDLAAADDAAGAEAAWREALAAALHAADDDRPEPEKRRESRRVDAVAHLALAGLALDRGDLAAAETALAAARETADGRTRAALATRFALAEGRLALARGDAETGWKRLRKSDAGSAEAWLWRAIAARATGRTSELATAIEKAEQLGGDAAALR
ncbi:MAG: hypothetical protein AMXMBFR36_22360 [Acidobacteriota bacterium]